jgi:hypothetical protein
VGAVNTKNLMTPVGRLVWQCLFQPGKAMEEGKKPQYQATLVFDKAAQATPEFAALKAAASAAAKETFGDKLQNDHFRQNLKTPFLSCDTHKSAKTETGEFRPGHMAGGVFIRFNSPTKPGIVDRNVQPILDSSEVYSGCFGRVSCNAFGYGNKPQHVGNKGVSFGLNHFQKVKDGEAIGGRGRPEDAFTAIGDEGGADAAVGAQAPADALFG